MLCQGHKSQPGGPPRSTCCFATTRGPTKEPMLCQGHTSQPGGPPRSTCDVRGGATRGPTKVTSKRSQYPSIHAPPSPRKSSMYKSMINPLKCQIKTISPRLNSKVKFGLCVASNKVARLHLQDATLVVVVDVLKTLPMYFDCSSHIKHIS